MYRPVSDLCAVRAVFWLPSRRELECCVPGCTVSADSVGFFCVKIFFCTKSYDRRSGEPRLSSHSYLLSYCLHAVRPASQPELQFPCPPKLPARFVRSTCLMKLFASSPPIHREDGCRPLYWGRAAVHPVGSGGFFCQKF